MGTVMRFLAGSAGLAFLAIAFGIVAPPLNAVLSDPWEIDAPGGALAVVGMILLGGSAPFLLGLGLIRKAVWGGIPAPAPSPPPVRNDTAAAPIEETRPPMEATERAAGGRVVAQPAENTPAPANGPVGVPTDPRRTWLTVFGLTVALFSALLELPAFAFAFRQDAGPGDTATSLMLMLFFLFPLTFGLWLAHVGEPGLLGRFAGDVKTLAASLCRPAGLAALLRNPMGLAFAIAVVCVPMMLIWQRVSPLIAVNGMIVYSLAEPIQNLFRRWWWLGATLSVVSWMGLLVVLVITAEAISPMREGSLIFLLPMMVFAAAIAFSALARLMLWAAAPSARPQ